MAQPLVLLSADEQQLRLSHLTSLMKQAKADAMLITDNANLYYLTGRVYAGLMFITADGRVTYFVRRPIELTGDNVIYIRKPEQMSEHISFGAGSLAMELDITDYSTIERLKAIFPSATMTNASTVIRKARSVKTAEELRLIGLSGIKQERVYRRIPHLYQDGMTDLELQVEIERVSRLEGCLGQFRISGNSMELYMANILTGENADTPTPYDFAMGGAGLDPSIPVGANGSIIRQGTAVMADVNGNYTGYMTDMTRTFSLGGLPEKAMKAHQLSIDICHELASMARPGTEAAAMFHRAEKMAREAGMYEYFMGHRQKAGFVGHGLGIEINELPVIAPRSRDILEEGNVFALEPKFVIPEVGAVGIENTYAVTADGVKCLTLAPEQIINFE